MRVSADQILRLRMAKLRLLKNLRKNGLSTTSLRSQSSVGRHRCRPAVVSQPFDCVPAARANQRLVIETSSLEIARNCFITARRHLDVLACNQYGSGRILLG